MGFIFNSYRLFEKFIFLLFLSLCTTPYTSSSQVNLIQNYSFEEYNNCPFSSHQLNLAKYWYNPCNGGPEYYNACANGFSTWGVPYCSGGFQYSRTGVGYAAFYLFYGTNYREYIGTTLISELKQDKYYNLSFFVNLANGSRYATDGISACVRKDTCECDHLHIPVQYLLDFQPQVNNLKGNILADTLNWMEVSGTFKAEGGEKYLIIGDFLPDEQNTIQLVGDPDAYPVCYYYIDDVSLFEVDSVSGLQDNELQQLAVYPNPASNKAWIDFPANFQEKTTIEIINTTGNLVLSKMIPAGTGRYELNLAVLPKGMYFYRVFSSSGKQKNGKIVVQ